MYEKVKIGDRFGNYTVVAEASPAITLSKRRRWLCKCVCGNERIVEEPNLRHGKSTNCGCVRYRNMIGNKYNLRENAHHKDRLHHIWISMRSRCNSKTNPSYRNYGEKGVSVCKEWDDYEAFKRWAYENGYDDKADYGVCTIDRINPYGNYEPPNCRWISNSEQQKNKRKDWDRRMKNAI